MHKWILKFNEMEASDEISEEQERQLAYDIIQAMQHTTGGLVTLIVHVGKQRQDKVKRTKKQQQNHYHFIVNKKAQSWARTTLPAGGRGRGGAT